MARLGRSQPFAPKIGRAVATLTTITGTSAQTLAAFTSAAAGTTTILGTSAQTLAAFTPSAAGTTAILGTSAQTLAAFTSSASGAVGSDVTGTVMATLADFTSTTAGTTTILGTSAQTLATFTSTASGVVPAIGAADITLDAFTPTASGSGGLYVETQTGQPFSGYTSPRPIPEPRTWQIAARGVVGMVGQGACVHIAPRVARHAARGSVKGLSGAGRAQHRNGLAEQLRRQAKIALLLRP
jgi:hypothetical protein